MWRASEIGKYFDIWSRGCGDDGSGDNGVHLDDILLKVIELIED